MPPKEPPGQIPSRPSTKKRKLPAFIKTPTPQEPPPKIIVVDELSREEDNTKWMKDQQPQGTSGPYGTYWRQFLSFCQKENLCPLPARPDTVISFLRHLLGEEKSRSTINKAAVSAIAEAHRLQGLPNPTVSDRVRLAKKAITRLTPPPKSKKPLLLSQIRRMIQILDANSVADIRDSFMLILMFVGLLRESEAANLKGDDLYVEEVSQDTSLCSCG